MSRNTKIIITLKIILWLIIIISSYRIYQWIVDNYHNDVLINEINDLINNNDSSINIDNPKLEEINNDIKGWIIVEGTNINYPFLQTNNNEYYLTHSIDKAKNNAGWIFMDYRNNIDNFNKNIILYGHNRINNTMFGDLKKTLTNEWLSNSNLIKLYTNKYNTIWQVFSIYHIKTTVDYLNIDFNNDEEYNNFIELIYNRSIYNFNNKPNRQDNILTLSTCYNDDKRIVIHAKLIEKEEI